MRLLPLAFVLCACENNGPVLIGPNDDGLTVDDTFGGPGGDACDQLTLSGICTDYVGSNFTDAEVATNCGNSGDVVVSCPTSDQLGRCDVEPGTPSETRTYYYDGPFWGDTDVPTLESQCSLAGGVWN